MLARQDWISSGVASSLVLILMTGCDEILYQERSVFQDVCNIVYGRETFMTQRSVHSWYYLEPLAVGNFCLCKFLLERGSARVPGRMNALQRARPIFLVLFIHQVACGAVVTQRGWYFLVKEEETRRQKGRGGGGAKEDNPFRGPMNTGQASTRISTWSGEAATHEKVWAGCLRGNLKSSNELKIRGLRFISSSQCATPPALRLVGFPGRHAACVCKYEHSMMAKREARSIDGR